MENRARLLNFTIHLNRDGNLEFDLNSVDTPSMESVLRKLGDPVYSQRVGKIVRNYFRVLSEKIAKYKII